MRRGNIYLGKVFNIPVGLDYSWFFIFFLLSWMLADNYYPHEFKQWPVWQYWLMGILTSVFFFVSVFLHELGHSLVARHFKLAVRNIILFVFGGVAQIAKEPPSARAEFWIAIAGPIVSFLLGIIFVFLESLFPENSAGLALVKYLGFINIALALFNLVPGFPLDGGRVLRAIVWGVTRDLQRSTKIAATVGRIFAFIFIYLGVMQIFHGNIGDGLWIIFIGWFLDNAASAQVQQQALRTSLIGHQVQEAMTTNYAVVPEDMTIQDLMDYHVLGRGRRCVIVLNGDEVVGLLTLHHLKEVDAEDWPETRVRQLMIPANQFKQVTPHSDLWEALEEMDSEGVNQLPVMDNGRLVGLLTRENLITFLKHLNVVPDSRR